jgi:RHS repeat-associated protein
VVTDDQANPPHLVEARTYWPEGDALAGTSSTSQRLRFATMERDTESNHFYDHARAHDFNLGRFLGVDKHWGHVRDPQSWNRYTYARDNPVKLVDPNGFEVMYANDHLRALFTYLSARLPQVRATLARYTGAGKPDLLIQRGDAGHDPLTGEKNRGSFVPLITPSYQRPDTSYTVSDPSGKDLWPATGKNLTGAELKSATLTLDSSLVAGSKEEANVAVHETGHADDAAKDPVAFEQNTADDMTHDANGVPLQHDDRPEERNANQYRDQACGQNRSCPEFPPKY